MDFKLIDSLDTHSKNQGENRTACSRRLNPRKGDESSEDLRLKESPPLDKNCGTSPTLRAIANDQQDPASVPNGTVAQDFF